MIRNFTQKLMKIKREIEEERKIANFIKNLPNEDIWEDEVVNDDEEEE